MKERYFWILIVVLLALINFATIYSFSNPTGIENVYNYLEVYKEAFDKVRDNYVDEEQVDPKNLIYGSIQGLLNSLGDEHTAFLDPDAFRDLMESTSGHFGGLGIYITIRDEWLTVISPIEDTPAYRSGIQAGDVIIEIEGESTEGISIEEAVSKLKGEPGTQVTIKILREGVPQPLEKTLTRDIINIETVKYKLLDNNIGYFRITQFSEDTTEKLREAFLDLQSQGMERMIVDLRNNPGGRLDTAIEVCDLFLDRGKIVFTKARYPSDNEVYLAHEYNTLSTDVPMIVLVNHGSASASEIFTGAMQDTHRGLVIGNTTFGKGSVQSVMELSNADEEKIGMRVTIAKYYTPAGRDIHGVGLEPDLTVEIPERTLEENFYEYLFRTEDYASEFLEQHPQYSDQELLEFQQTLADNCIMLDMDRIRKLLRDEAMETSPPIVADEQFDELLKKAIAIFENNEYPEKDIIYYEEE